jgi:diamine N-acetyltransferase
MNNEEILIREIDKDNWYECCNLEVSKDQEKYFESNAMSIAQSKFELTLRPLAIYYRKKIVGFVMYNSIKEELNSFWIYRIMVDKNYQGMGVGKKAGKLIIEQMGKLPECSRIAVGYHLENLGSHNLFAKLGFKDHGDRFGKEMAVLLELHVKINN